MKISDEMVDAGARAICDYLGRSWGAADGSAQDKWRDMARAALEAVALMIDEGFDA
jgi:hypothetical protein